MTKTIEVSCTYLVPAKVLYNAFLDSRDLSRMTLCEAKISPVIGGEFVLYNGGVTGTVKSLEPDHKIVEDWRFSQWEQGTFSSLELSFVSLGPAKTRLEIRQSNIPEKDGHGNPEQDRLVLNGWKEKFFMTLEKVLGFAVDRD